MRGRRIVILVCVLLSACFIVDGQTIPDKKSTKGKINQKDHKGRKTGTWVNNIPETKGEPSFTEFGNYADNLKHGLWYKMAGGGNLVAIENYKQDQLDGEVKYFTKGQVTCIGVYRGLNPDVAFDTVLVTEPVTGEERLVAVEADRGSVKHGTWRFYDELTGAITKVEEYQVDSLIYEEYYTMSKADSAYYERRNKNLPHTKKSIARPVKKQHSYLN